MTKLRGKWQNMQHLFGSSYKCGHCHTVVAGDRGYDFSHASGESPSAVTLCVNCNRPTYLEGETQVPGVRLGDPVGSLPNEVSSLYEEARACTTINAHTSAILGLRKLLMHIAVQKGGKPGMKFIEYVDYLDSKGYVPPDGKDWVDQIRERGNEANHEIVIMGPEVAEELLAFAGMLLKFIYEFPAKMRRASGNDEE